MKLNFDHFDLLAPFYERVFPPKSIKKLADLTGFPIEGLLLDAGGGTGRIAQKLVGQAGQILVVDASGGMLKQVSQKEGLIPVHSQTEALPIQDERCERIVMVDALHHVIDQEQTAVELWRVLQPGGRLVIEEPDLRHWAIKLVALFEKLALMRSRFLTSEQIAGLFPSNQTCVRIETEGLLVWVVIEKEAKINEGVKI